MDPEHPFEPELGPEYTESLDATPLSPPQLEERVVAELRARALLGGRPSARGPAPARSRERRTRPAWFIGMAAAVAAFALGVRVGENRSMTWTPVSAAAVDSVEPANHVEQAAFDYISALSSVNVTDLEGRAAAIGTFRTAADQIVRLAPHSEIARAIKLAFPASFVASPATEAVMAPSTSVIWF
jgi:hypothetical protein